MEHHIHTHLFSTALSLKENRLLSFAGTPEQQNFDAAIVKIEASIDNPDERTDMPIQGMTKLRLLAINSKLTGEDKIDQLQSIIDTKAKLQESIHDTERKTAEDNPDWKKIEDDFVSTGSGVKDAAVQHMKQVITDSRANISLLSSTIADLDLPQARLLAKTTVALIAAHNKNIENVQAVDPSNTVALVEPRTGGLDATEALKKIKDFGVEFLTNDFNTLLNQYTTGATQSIKNKFLVQIDEQMKDRREEIYQKMQDVTENYPPYVNVEQMIAELLSQLKEMKNARDEVVEAVPASSPAPSAVPETAVDALAALPPDKVKAVTDATTPEEFSNALDDLGATTDLGGIAKALNEKPGKKFNVKVQDDKLVRDTAITTAVETGTEAVTEKVSQLKQIIEAIKEFIEWVMNKEAEMKGGTNVPNMRKHIEGLKTKKGQLLEKNTPKSLREADEINQQIVELEVQLKTIEDNNNKMRNHLARDIRENPSLQVEQPGGSGMPPALCNSPGVAPSVANSQFATILNGLTPEQRDNVKQQTIDGNTYLLFIGGDVNITNDQSRNINVTGDNNTVEESQNGTTIGDGSLGSPKNLNIDGAIPVVPILEVNPVDVGERGDVFEEAPIVQENPVKEAIRGNLEPPVPRF